MLKIIYYYHLPVQEEMACHNLLYTIIIYSTLIVSQSAIMQSTIVHTRNLCDVNWYGRGGITVTW
jgi:hypothetical protein